MSTGEVAGLALAVGSLGAVVGAAVAVWLTSRHFRAETTRNGKRDALAHWLAARMTLTRASVSFVAAFRSLARERSDSNYYPLRQQEAQRTRVQWCDAVRELDLAEASLRVWAWTPSLQEWLMRFDHIDASTLRDTINGTEQDVCSLLSELHDSDRIAIQFVDSAVAEIDRSPKRPRFRDVLERTIEDVRIIVDRWSKQ